MNPLLRSPFRLVWRVLATKIALVALLLVAALMPHAATAQEPVPQSAAPDIPNGRKVYLPAVHSLDVHIAIGPLLQPFDANAKDLVGPWGWETNYGKTPEIIVAARGRELDILAQDYDAATPWNAVLLHVVSDGESRAYRVTQALTAMPMLDRVLGMDVDDAGNRYYAVAVAEQAVVNSTYPPPNTYRSNIVRVIKLNWAGDVVFDVDLDLARHAFNPNAEMIINPMTFATGRLAVGGGEIAIVHGINTAPDWNISGARHQKALSTRLDTDGNVTRTNSIWVSHSFDQRLFYDGQGIIENHLGDAYPREVVFSRNHISYPLFPIKGPLGENLTATRLGNMALIAHDPTYGYLALFATESTSEPGVIGSQMIMGPRNLAIVRVNRSDNSLDPSMPHVLTVTSSGSVHTNRLRWLTGYSTDSRLHAERPKLVRVDDDQYVVLWEEWHNPGPDSDQFNGVYAMVINAQGDPLRGPALITSQHHLPRGDDAFLLDGRAGWVTGSAPQRKLFIHLVDALLNYEMATLE